MGYCIWLPKSLLFVANTFFLTCGVLTMTMTIWMLIDSQEFVNHFGHIPRNGTEIHQTMYDFGQPLVFVLVALGMVLVFFAFFGFYGTIFEKPFVMFGFSIIIVALLLLKITLGIFMIAYEKEVDVTIQDILVSSVKSSYQNVAERNFESFVWDEIFITHNCCGVTNASDFVNGMDWIPPSCCYLEPSPKTNCMGENYKDYLGCFQVITDILNDNKGYVISAIIAIMAIEIFVIASGFFLVRLSTFSRKTFSRP